MVVAVVGEDVDGLVLALDVVRKAALVALSSTVGSVLLLLHHHHHSVLPLNFLLIDELLLDLVLLGDGARFFRIEWLVLFQRLFTELAVFFVGGGGDLSLLDGFEELVHHGRGRAGGIFLLEGGRFLEGCSLLDFLLVGVDVVLLLDFFTGETPAFFAGGVAGDVEAIVVADTIRVVDLRFLVEIIFRREVEDSLGLRGL